MTSPRSDRPRLAPSAPDLVWFSGADARRFLNDLISQEIGDLNAGEVRRSFLLGPQGKLDFMLKVFVEGDRVGLLTDPGRGEDLASSLGRYRIRVDVEIELDERERWVVVGDCEGIDISWPTVRRCLVFGPRPDLDVIPSEEYESMRIEAGVPRWGVDVDGSTIPHESGLVPLSVDFDKGCFLGQELVARIDSRGGNAPRHLRRLKLSSGVDEGAEVRKGDKVVGSASSVAGHLALGLIHRDIGVGDKVSVSGVDAEVLALPIEIGE